MMNLEELQPKEATFELSEKPGKQFVLKKFSLSERIWINQRFGKEKVRDIFDTQSLPELAEIAHRLLKDKSEFPTFEVFAENIVSIKDQLSLTKALLRTVGIDDEVIKELAKKMGDETDPNAQSPIP